MSLIWKKISYCTAILQMNWMNWKFQNQNLQNVKGKLWACIHESLSIYMYYIIWVLLSSASNGFWKLNTIETFYALYPSTVCAKTFLVWIFYTSTWTPLNELLKTNICALCIKVFFSHSVSFYRDFVIHVYYVQRNSLLYFIINKSTEWLLNSKMDDKN